MKYCEDDVDVLVLLTSLEIAIQHSHSYRRDRFVSIFCPTNRVPVEMCIESTRKKLEKDV